MAKPSHGQTGQALLEILLLLAAILSAVMLLVTPFAQSISSLFTADAERMEHASATFGRAMVGVSPSADEREQEEPEAQAEDEGPIVVAAGPGHGPPLGPSQPYVSGGTGTGGIGGSGGGSGGSIGGGRIDGGGRGGVSPTVFIPVSPTVTGQGPNATQRALIDAARALLLASPVTFNLFDFSLGRVITLSVAQIVNNIGRYGVPILVGDLTDSLAAVFFSENTDGTLDLAAPIRLVFDRTVLAASTKEVVAAILAHEGWHVNQLFNGIHNDRRNFPRVVDIEYEAFVAEAAVWNAIKDGQSNSALDAGSVCVASGEARCKELLATDFHYPTGPR